MIDVVHNQLSFSYLKLLNGRAKNSEAAKLAERVNQMRSEAPGQLPYLFADIVEPEKIEGARDVNGVLKVRRRKYCPATTFWGMCGQVMRGGSLREATREIEASCCARKAPGQSGSSTSSYSDARKRLPLKSLEDVHERVYQKMMDAEKLFDGRRVMIVDGSSCQLADTDANQDYYPQPSNQKEGCGHPVVQLVGLFNLGTRALEHVSLSPATAHEGSIFDVELSQHLKEGDVLMADRGFCSYLHFASLRERGVDVIMRLHSSRRWPKGVKGDDVEVEWTRPPLSERPEHISEEEWLALPKTTTVRYVRHRIQHKGFRTSMVMIVTTLPKSEASAQKLAQGYGRRWQIELCFDDLKTTLGMDFINVKTPLMAAKMITVYIIVHNLVRLTMQRAVMAAHQKWGRESFKGALDAIKCYSTEMHRATKKVRSDLKEKLYKTIIKDKVPDRPWRVEPRVRKLRPKPFPLMTKARAVLKGVIIENMRLAPA